MMIAYLYSRLPGRLINGLEGATMHDSSNCDRGWYYTGFRIPFLSTRLTCFTNILPPHHANHEKRGAHSNSTALVSKGIPAKKSPHDYKPLPEIASRRCYLLVLLTNTKNSFSVSSTVFIWSWCAQGNKLGAEQGLCVGVRRSASSSNVLWKWISVSPTMQKLSTQVVLGKSLICGSITVGMNCSAAIRQRTSTRMPDVVPGSGCQIGHSEEGAAVSSFFFAF